MTPYDIVPNPHNVNWGYSGSLLVDAIEHLSLVGPRASIIPEREYLGALLCLLCSWWLEAVISDVSSKRNVLVQRLIRRGADIHYSDPYGNTPLRNLVWNSSRGNDAEIVQEWLSLLKTCHVNLTDYIKKACQLNPGEFELREYEQSLDGWREYTHVRPRKFVISDVSLGEPTILVEQWCSPNSTAKLLLKEYNFSADLVIGGGMCQMAKYWIESSVIGVENYDQSSMQSISRVLKQWLNDEGESLESTPNRDEPTGWYERFQYYQERQDNASIARMLLEYSSNLCHCDLDGHYIDLWPFYGGTHTMCQTGSMVTRGCFRCEDWCEFHVCRFNHKRFTRKQEKKLEKAMRRAGLSCSKSTMPGAWIGG